MFHYSKSTDTLSRLVKDKKFVSTAIKVFFSIIFSLCLFPQQCAEKDRSGRSLGNLLLEPISHIKTYLAFVQSLLDATATSSPDYDPLDDILTLLLEFDEKLEAATQASDQFRIPFLPVLILMLIH